MGGSAAGFAFDQGVAIAVDGRLVADGRVVQTLGLFDWIADPHHAKLGSGCLADDGIVKCNEPHVTARPGATGSWYGLRIVDDLLGHDDVFTSTSKFDDPSTWTVTLGKVGGKHDASEVYLANTTDYLYIAMLRLGNNGSTAFDVEFNQLPPEPGNFHVPIRSPGDVMMVFELVGSGSSATVEVDGYEWDGVRWIAFAIPPNTHRHLNAAVTAGPPWGTRDADERWGAHELARFTFAEVGLPIGARGIELPVSLAEGRRSAWVGIRTRASSGFDGAMKDAFEYVRYDFSGISVAAGLTDPSIGGGDPARGITQLVTPRSPD